MVMNRRVVDTVELCLDESHNKTNKGGGGRVGSQDGQRH